MDKEVFDRVMFIALDKDESGFISIDEYQRYSYRRANFSKKKRPKIPEIKAEFKEIDKNNNGKIKFEGLYINITYLFSQHFSLKQMNFLELQEWIGKKEAEVEKESKKD